MEQNFKNVNESAGKVNSLTANYAQQKAPEAAGLDSFSDFNVGLKSIFGDDFDINDKMSRDLLLYQLRRNIEQNEILANALDQDPRMAQMISDVVNGKRNAHSAMARYFGNSLLNVDENSPEFEEIMNADAERKNEIMRLANDRREYENNLAESIPVIEAFCNERGYDVSDFMDNVWESVVFPIMAGRYSTDVCVALDHALSYDKDVQDAFAAGDIKGRNTSIQRMKANFSDGMPKGMNSVAPETGKRTRRNSLIERALNA
ncbi:MAG: hypothetical protein J6U58_07475 [Bacteroidaceae bacterium]|nr:hypothetical protein [Bacteroidaceae bacterium]